MWWGGGGGGYCKANTFNAFVHMGGLNQTIGPT